MMEVMSEIYPKELKLVPDDSNGLTPSILDLLLQIQDGHISTSILIKGMILISQ